MTDYIAFDENNVAYSIYDVEKNEYLKKCNLYCICSEKVFIEKIVLFFKIKMELLNKK